MKVHGHGFTHQTSFKIRLNKKNIAEMRIMQILKETKNNVQAKTIRDT